MGYVTCTPWDQMYMTMEHCLASDRTGVDTDIKAVHRHILGKNSCSEQLQQLLASQ
jgi:hypothetical protein